MLNNTGCSKLFPWDLGTLHLQWGPYQIKLMARLENLDLSDVPPSLDRPGFWVDILNLRTLDDLVEQVHALSPEGDA